jgi:hypothetical protein
MLRAVCYFEQLAHINNSKTKTKLYVSYLFPSTDLTELVEQKDTSTLCSSNRFHDPHSIRPTLKLFDEQAVVLWQTVCLSPA